MVGIMCGFYACCFYDFARRNEFHCPGKISTPAKCSRIEVLQLDNILLNTEVHLLAHKPCRQNGQLKTVCGI